MFEQVNNIILADPSASVVSFHPAHLTGSQDRLLPAALIPFCSYQGRTLGNEIDGFVSCDKFQPTVLEGQMCYSLDLNTIDNVNKSGSGKGNGILMVFDSNQENKLARIHLHTLSPFTSNRNGSYAMSSLKKMTGTTDFLKMPDAIKKCNVEPFANCNTKNYFEKIRNKCKCVLWALNKIQQVEHKIMGLF